MPFVKTGKIKNHCAPNALSTFLEYLIDYATPETREAGKAFIANEVELMAEADRNRAEALLDRVEAGGRGCLC